MQQVKIIHPDEFVSMPWRNGLGTTIELYKQEQAGNASGDFDWRLSMASVVDDGEFSNFAGYDRTLVLLTGAGLTLEFLNSDSTTLTEPLQLARFKGETQTIAKLHSGEITDFNIMTHRHICDAEVVTSIEGRDVKVENADNQLAIYSVEETLSVSVFDDTDFSIPAGSLALIENPKAGLYNVADAGFIAVKISNH